MSIIFGVISIGLIYFQASNRCNAIKKEPKFSKIATNVSLMSLFALIGILVYIYVFSNLLTDPYIKVIEGPEFNINNAEQFSKTISNGANITMILWLVNSLFFYRNVCS